MARLTKPERMTFERRSLHDEVASCLYDVYDLDGKRYLQINTYGRAGRATPEKPSQVIQLDEKGARYLRELLEQAFPES